MTAILAIVAAFYFLPTLIGLGKRNRGAIFVLNAFLGWTFIGWVLALVWACMAEEPRVPPVQGRLATVIANSHQDDFGYE